MLSVKEVAEIFQTTPQTIYTWVSKGILKPDIQTPTNRRYFSDEQINRVLKGGISNEDAEEIKEI